MLQLLDYFGVIVFAVTGCLVAARKRVDLIGFIWLAIVTAIGGGTVRDLVLGVPVFWVHAPIYLILCLVTSGVMFFAAHWIQRQIRLILWFDAVGLAVFAVIGTQISLDSGANILTAMLLGVLTATLGGVLRDLLAGEPTLIMRREIYVTAASLSSGTYIALFFLGTPSGVAVLVAIMAGFMLRALALRYRLKLPGYGWLRPVESPNGNRRKAG